jgi:hypothetical protein
LPKEWAVPIEYVLVLISAFMAILACLWMGVVVRVFVNNESRLVALEEYKSHEVIRNELLVSRFKEMLSQLEIRLGANLEAKLETKRASIEQTITQMGNEVVNAVKKNGGTK